eukprot:CAMPEP_0167752546 /NCGR_PEP_ID=MMETSP0110_2-20121227/7202_1 /TAXON_ID=629695 /ORGANISM="Gymnochlora sp., Strain CCMP2014" /LENGTH=179 /DNA_ID=CAMNT_0007638181 /DNA_START=248 /DNA_END=787 /DNA_ORIENTATION=+
MIPLRRTMSASSFESYQEEEISTRTSSPISENENAPDYQDPNPMDMISAAATTVEFHEQSREIDLLVHQCMVVQQDFDDMLAEKEELIHKESKERKAAEVRALKAEEKLKKFLKERRTLECKLFELSAELKAKEAQLAHLNVPKRKTNVVRNRKRKAVCKEEHQLALSKKSKSSRRGSF